MTLGPCLALLLVNGTSWISGPVLEAVVILDSTVHFVL